LAYISCLKEVRLIADLLFERGLTGMRDAISNTAKYGSAVAGPRIIDEHAHESLRELLSEIEDGRFASTFLADKDGEKLSAFRDLEKNSQLAKTGNELKESLKF
jgi:ketol-acid reductoisomerase